MKKLLAFFPLLMCLSGFAQTPENMWSGSDNTTVEDSAPESESDFPSLSEWSETRKESTYKYPKMDLDMKIYLPSLLGSVTGENPYLHLREDWASVSKCTNFFIETRGDILPVGDFSFSWSFGFNAYIESRAMPPDRDYTYMGVSLGAGVYYDPWFSQYPTSMHGLCLYLYPMYELPFYWNSDEKFVNWKCAADIGVNIIAMDIITIYPYMRDIIAWTKDGVKVGMDFGIAIGVYLPDFKYREAHR